MKQDKEKKSKIVKKEEQEKVTRVYDICDCPYFIRTHVHLKGCITLVKDNEEHKIKLRLPVNISL